MNTGKKDKFAASVEKMSFEQALARLEEIVARLESGRAELEESIAIYEEGMILKAHCQQKLDEARLRIEKVTKTAGQIKLEPGEDMRETPPKPGAETP